VTILFEFGAQSIDVISLSCYLVISLWNVIRSQTVRTSDRLSVAFQSFPALENICASFEFKLTATSDNVSDSIPVRSDKVGTHGIYPG